MSIKQRKLLLLIALILFFVFFIMPSASEGKKGVNDNKNNITITTQDPDLPINLLVGDPKKPINNPKSVSIEELLANNDSYKESLKARENDLYGKASIYESKAIDEVTKLIQEYAQEKNILYILKEEFLFKLLKTLPDFSDKSENELKEQFDITGDILEYEKQKKEELEKTKEKFKKEEEKSFMRDIFLD